MSDEVEVRTLLARLGAALVAAGQPVNEVEADLQEVGTALGFPDAQIAAAPTGVTLSLAVGSPSTFAANPGTLRLDQASEVREIRHLLARGRLDPPAATARLLTSDASPDETPGASTNEASGADGRGATVRTSAQPSPDRTAASARDRCTC